MIPLKADVPSGSVPFATMGLIAPNVLLFLATIFTSMFLHRGLLHVAGTMLYPYASVLIFGFFVRIVRWAGDDRARLVDRDPVHQRG
jgi:membrane associated rhomboid family serine protease